MATTENTHPVGSVLTRKTAKNDSHDVLVVVGTGSKIVVQSQTDFESPWTLPSSEAFADYDIEIPEIPDNKPGSKYQGLSPEEAFKNYAAADAAITPTQAERPTPVAKPAAKRQSAAEKKAEAAAKAAD